MRTLIAVAASTLLCTSALACEFHGADAHAAPDPSIASKKEAAAPTSVASSKKATTVAASKPKKDAKVAASSAPKPVYFEQRAAN